MLCKTLRRPVVLLAALTVLTFHTAGLRAQVPNGPALSPAAVRAVLNPALRRAARKPVDPGTPLAALRPLRLMLASDLAASNSAAALEAELRQRADVAIGADAEFELDTLPDFPQTLVIKSRGLDIDNRDPAGEPGERFAELGNLVLDDYHAALDAALRRRLWTRRAIGLGAVSPAAPATTTCVTDMSDWTDRIRCDLAPHMVAVEGPEPAPLRGTSAFAVRNNTPAPRYLYLIDIDPNGTVTVLPLSAGEPVAPGQWAVHSEREVHNRGEHVLVTFSSDRPVRPDLLDGRSFLTASAEDCALPLAAFLCARDPAPDSSWSATASAYELDGPFFGQIGGGYRAPPDEAPWMVELYSTVPYKPEDFAADDARPPAERRYLRERRGPGLAHRCGATLIDDDLILTAAHCVAKDEFEGPRMADVFVKRRVRLFSTRLGDDGETRAIDGMVVHAGYRGGRQSRDIALLHLKSDRGARRSRIMLVAAMSGPNDKPGFYARLPDEVAPFSLKAGTPLTAYGWGFTRALAAGSNIFLSVNNEVQQNPDDLQGGKLEALDWKTCNQRMDGVLDAGMMCAVTRAEVARANPGAKVFSCVGDSGGPLIYRAPEGAVLVGITSWSRGCGMGDDPSVYSNVAKFGSWIAAARKVLRPGAALTLPDQPATPPPARAQTASP